MRLFPIAVSVEEAGQMLGCGRSMVFELLARGTLKRAKRYGKEIRILTDSIEKALTETAARAKRARGPERWSIEDVAI